MENELPTRNVSLRNHGNLTWVTGRESLISLNSPMNSNVGLIKTI